MTVGSPSAGPILPLTVVIPVHGGGTIVDRCVRQVLEHTDFERHRLLVVVDADPMFAQRPIAAVLAGSARFTPKLTLGYRDAVTVTDSVVFPAGTRVTGHEFHRTTIDYTAEYSPAWKFRDATGATVADGAAHRAVFGGYLHTHPAASPAAVRRFVEHAVKLTG